MEKKIDGNFAKEIVLYDTPYCLIRLFPEIPFLQVKWRKSITGEQYREVLELLLEVMANEKVTKFIYDDRELPIIDPQYVQWSTKEWLPRAVALGYGNIAVVQTKEFFKKLPAEMIAKGATEFYEGMIKMAYFRNVHDAENWLKTQK
jgi:hypothetical protein